MTSGFLYRAGTCILLLLLSAEANALELDARSDFSQRFELNASVSGIVSRVLVRVGQKVKKGDVLLELDKASYQSALSRAQAIVKSHEPAKVQMQSELEKARELFDRDSLSLIDLQIAENNLQEAEGQLDAVKADVINAELELQKTSLRAPVDARVLAIHTHQERFINPNVSEQTLVTLVNVDQMLAIGSLSPSKWNPALLGKAVSISYRGKKYQGKVIELGFDQASQSDPSPVFELKVLFVASGEIPANMPLTILIQE